MPRADELSPSPGALRTALFVRHDITDHMERADMRQPTERKDPIENTEPAEPTLPTDSTEPIEPTESTDPREPMDRTESRDHSDHREPFPPLSTGTLFLLRAFAGSLRPAPSIVAIPRCG